ncbi:type II secretion system F family protein [Yinghuangia soli]|uniref:Type II secretion system F family protein n=1 Tax=Yinghuangia soli TaxID=2908204 RepID=A0AA41U4P4_9ACTN|nr:type II secretion system F family protein [Yinghuangia soli]MCF2529229.1 type II secretion system F family protein [Yinghuangia soli]
MRVGLPVLAGGAMLGFTASSPVPVLVALPVGVFLVRRRVRADAQREFAALRTGVAEVATAMVGELRAGQQPPEAFAAAVESVDGPVRARLAEAVAVARIGGDVAAALDRAAGPPGMDSLVRVAACWRIAAERGAGFAAALGRVAAGLRAEEAGHLEAAAELSGARSTARLLALLPVFGIVLGQLAGARPLDVLLHTAPGFVCLVVGLLLVALGLLWTDRIARGGGPWTA